MSGQIASFTLFCILFFCFFCTPASRFTLKALSRWQVSGDRTSMCACSRPPSQQSSIIMGNKKKGKEERRSKLASVGYPSVRLVSSMQSRLSVLPPDLPDMQPHIKQNMYRAGDEEALGKFQASVLPPARLPMVIRPAHPGKEDREEYSLGCPNSPKNK
ncbi:hypothetical protein GGR56DRAFT_221542 [Xylariaceae sp. FL0804]|nr:hypothetical protein GGR56DRAFT_221542 [Xylariaceae sp. FL0804]